MSLLRHPSSSSWRLRLHAGRGCRVRTLQSLLRLLLQALDGAGLAGPVAAQDAALGANLQGLLDYAKAQSPELGAMRQEAQAAAERVQPAGALPDPVLRVELMNFNNYGNGGSPSLLPSQVGETKYTLMQPLPAWGKRDLRRDVAAAQAGQAAARTDAAWAELAMRIKTSYADYYRVAGNERLAREVLDLMARLEQVAQADGRNWTCSSNDRGEPRVLRGLRQSAPLEAPSFTEDTRRIAKWRWYLLRARLPAGRSATA